MNSLIARKLEARLIAIVGAVLLVFSIVAAVFTYNYVYQHQLAQAESLQQQLVLTVRAQAEVAAFAANMEIAQGVIHGLLANPVILAVRIESLDGFRAEQGSRKDVALSDGRAYPLFSPVDAIERIGSIIIVQNEQQVNRSAGQAALFQTAMMLVQVLIAVAIMAIVLRVLMIRPISRLAREMVEIKPGSSIRLKTESRHANDEIGQLAQSVNVLLDAAEAAIEEVKAQRNELERLATHDHLTGLPTLRLADDRLRIACSNAVRMGQKVALLFLDLDAFKPINDNFGHETGDEVLKEVARRLRENIRAEDTAARIGGDEFLLILGGLGDASFAARVAEDIGKVLTQPMEINGHSFTIGASIGIALFPDHSGNVEVLRRIADQAMYEVKKSGKGHFAFCQMPQQAS